MDFSFFGKNKKTEEAVLTKGQQKDPRFILQNVPIQTMKKDLDEIINPQKVETKPETPKPLPVQNPIAEKPTVNPFMDNSPVPKKFNAPAQGSTPIPVSGNIKPGSTPISSAAKKFGITEKNEPSFVKEQAVKVSQNPDEKLKIGIFVILGVVLLFFIGGSVYYFFKTSEPEDQPIEQPIPQPGSGTTEPQPQPQPPIEIFSTDKPNYLTVESIESEEFNESSFREIVSQNFTKIVEQQTTSPIEFIITDKNNNPVSFKTFALKIGMSFPEPILNNLSDTFSFFIFNDSGNKSVGIAIDSKDDIALEKAMLNEEPNLFKDIKPLLPIAEKADNQKKFADGEIYKTLKVRFKNIISPIQLSIDWSVNNKKLLIGTTKDSIRSIFDYLSTPKTAEPENLTIPITEEQPKNEGISETNPVISDENTQENQ